MMFQSNPDTDDEEEEVSEVDLLQVKSFQQNFSEDSGSKRKILGFERNFVFTETSKSVNLWN